MSNKKFLSLLTVLFTSFLFTCCKKSSSNGPSPVATMFFKAGDSSFSWSGDQTSAQTFGILILVDTFNRFYQIQGVPNQADNLTLRIFSYPLAETTYVGQGPTATRVNTYINAALFGYIWTTTLGASITITSIHDNMVDGTFTSPGLHGGGDSITITNGVFQNVKMHVQ